jgi:hypothetical protein
MIQPRTAALNFRSPNAEKFVERVGNIDVM